MNSTLLRSAAADRTIILGPWVQVRSEGCRGGRRVWVAVNRRDRVALTLTPDQAAGLKSDGTTLVVRDPDLWNDLVTNGFDATAPAPVAAPRRRLAGLRGFLRTLDVGVHHAQPAIETLHRRLGRLAFTRFGVAAQIVVALLGAMAFLHAMRGPGQLQFRAHPGQVPLVLALSLTAIACHELAHALVVVHHGRRIDTIGFRLHLGTPAFYVQAVEGLLLTRRQRMIQAFAGSWAEWQFTSLVALCLWALPSASISVVLYRFLIFNAITIGSNLLPFTGLDGHLLLADLIGEPDLEQQTRGALGRLATMLAAGRRPTRRESLLAGFCLVNGVVAAVLLACAGLFWYALFGGVLSGLVAAGPTGRLVLAAVAFLLGRPVVLAGRDRVASVVDTATELTSRLSFRMQWRWRIPAVEALAAAVPAVAGLGEHGLSVLAGRAERRRVTGTPLRLDQYAYVQRGSVLLRDRRVRRGAILAPGDVVSGRRGGRPVVVAMPGAGQCAYDSSVC